MVCTSIQSSLKAKFFPRVTVFGQTTLYHDIWQERASWVGYICTYRAGCELSRMRPLCSSDRRRVSLVCRTQTEVWCTKPNRRRGLSPAVSVKNPISPAAFGLRWNSYFHHDLWVAPKKSSIFCIHLRPKVARPKISNFCVGSDGNIRAENVSHPTREGCDGYVACKLTLSQVEKEQDNSLRTHGGHVNSLRFDSPFLPPSWSSNFSSQPCPYSLLFINWSPLKGFL